MSELQTFVLSILKHAGAQISPEADQRSFHANISPELVPYFRGTQSLHFTFDKEYYDQFLETGVEFVAPGYPLLDQLIAYARSQFVVSEGEVTGQPLPRLHLHGSSLTLEPHEHRERRTLLGFYIKLIVQGEEYDEQLFSIWADTVSKTVLSHPPDLSDVRPTQTPAILPEAEVDATWQIALAEIDNQVSKRLASFEESANIRLHSELQRLDRLGASRSDREERKKRYRLEGKTELVFTEMLHLPVQVWQVTASRQNWQHDYRYRYDMVAKRWIDGPTCPVCRQPGFRFEPCDAGQHIVCPRCAGVCYGCKAKHCSDHPTQPCRDCGHGHCPRCLNACHLCQDLLCPECTIVCPACDQHTCSRDILACEVCRYSACKEHFSACHISGHHLCQTHVRHCAACQQTTHSDYLHDVEGRHLCERCASPCHAAHQTRRWVANTPQNICAAPHAQPHVLCHDHQQRCALHQRTVAFCSQHVASCTECQRLVCSDHRRTSELSKRTYCNDHIAQCPRCRRLAGRSELAQVHGGDWLCYECSSTCHMCEGRLWSLDALKPCPFCLIRALKQGTAQTTTSADLLKRRNSHLNLCPDHRRACHICNREGCTTHVWHCSVCNELTCSDDLVTTVTGLHACKRCTASCAMCSADAYYLRTDLASCHICKTLSCQTHKTACTSCLEAVCTTHRHNCGLCGDIYCSHCMQGDHCHVCASLHLEPVDALASLPYSQPPQEDTVMSTEYQRRDGVTYRHVLYYPKPSNVGLLLGLAGRTPAPQLDIFRREGQDWRRLKTFSPTTKTPLPHFPRWTHILTRWTGRKR